MSPISTLFMTLIETMFRDSRNNIAGPEDGACSRKRCYSCACEPKSLRSSRAFFLPLSPATSSIPGRNISFGRDVSSSPITLELCQRKFLSRPPSNCVRERVLRLSRRVGAFCPAVLHLNAHRIDPVGGYRLHRRQTVPVSVSFGTCAYLRVDGCVRKCVIETHARPTTTSTRARM